MKETVTRRRLLASSAISGAALLSMASVAHAGDGPPAARAAERIETLTAASDEASAPASTQVTEIVVTGSRIPQPNLASVSPVQAIGHQDFELSGKTDVIDLLNTLPQNFQNNTADLSNTTNPLTAPGGVTTADLRGLGPQRTLVLVNGRRLGMGDPNTANPNPAPDLDQVPVSLIDHVEVLTGGASSTYGSDAIAGVVNFIMKKDFEGLQLDGQFGIDQHDNHEGLIQQAIRAAGHDPATGSHWDGRSTDFSVVFGANAPDGKGNVTGYFEFKNQQPVTEGERDYSGCLLVQVPGDACADSSNSNLFQPIVGGIPTGPYSVVGNQFLPRPQAGSNPPATFNSSPYEYLSRQDTRYLAGFFAHYDIAPWAQPYAEFSFMNDTSHVAVAPSGLFQGANTLAGSGGNWFVNCGNPFLSAQESGLMGCAGMPGDTQVALNIGRRNIEGGPRTSEYDHVNYRIVLGMKGDFADAWHYDAYGSYYNTSLFNANGGYLSISGIQSALLVNGTAANPQCTNGLPSCVPYDLFNEGGVTAAQVASLTKPGTSRGVIEEQIFEGDITGDLGKYGVKSPWADHGVGVSFGIQHIWDHLVFTPDAAELSGDLSGFGGASVAVNNAIGVQEEYFEARFPIAEHQPFIDHLSIEGGYRYSDYSSVGGASTYRVGGEWGPTPDFKLRASYDRALRAPSILEAFSPATVTNTSIVSEDPCAPDPTTGHALATLEQCMRTGVTAAQYGNGGTTNQIIQCPAGQCAILQAGSTNLQPETADTWSIGVTFTPRFLHGFSGSIDYYDIKLTDALGVVPISLDLAECLANGDPQFCSQIVRVPSSPTNVGGGLFGTTVGGGGYIRSITGNVAAGVNRGIDFQGAYRLNLEDLGATGVGSVAFNFVGSYLLEQSTTVAPGVAPYDCVGLFGPTCGTVNPNWRHTFRVTWNTPWNVLASLQWRYIGPTTLDANSSQTTLALLTSLSQSGGFGPGDDRLEPRNYLDLSAAWRVNGMVTLRGGVNNILDQDPPIVSQPVAGTGAPNAYPTYDLLGRQLFVSATVKF